MPPRGKHEDALHGGTIVGNFAGRAYIGGGFITVKSMEAPLLELIRRLVHHRQVHG